MRQRANSPQRPQRWACALPLQRPRAPSPVRTRRRQARRPLWPGRKAVGRAPFAAQHRARDRRGAPEGGQTGKKKRRRPTRYCRTCGRKQRRNSAGKCSDWMKCGRSWAAGGTKHGSGGPSDAPADAAWPGGWAGAMRPRPAASGPPCPGATAAIAGISPIYSRPTPRHCQPVRIGPLPKAKARPASSRR